MKKIRILLIALAAGMAAVSCVKSERLPEPPRGGGKRTAVPVSLAPVQMTTVSDGFTKAAGELTTAEDARIYDLWAIQYDGSGNIVGIPYYTDQMPAATAGSAGVDSTYGMTVMLSQSTDAAGKVYFIANTHSETLFTEDNVAQEADLKAMSQALTGEYKPAAGTGIPMMGLYTGAVNSSSLADVEMKRLAAKILLRYKSSLPGFEFKSVRLINASAGMYYAPEPAAGTDFPAAGQDSHSDYPAEDLTRAGVDADYKTFVWYVPENCRKAVAPVLAAGDRTLDKTDGKATCIEITGVLRDGDRCRKGTLRVLLGDLGAGGTDYDNFDVRRNTAYTFTVDMKGLNEGDYRLTVEDYDMSNSAMIQPQGADSVVFDIRKLTNGWQTTMPALGADAELRAELLWTDNADLASQLNVNLDKVNGLLAVKSEGAAEGNAVIALYNSKTAGNGDILWSWHVWVTDYRPSQAGVAARAINTTYTVPGGQVHTYGTEFQKVNGTSRVIMDRNLGATAALYALSTTNAENYPTYGLFYQWGRKDPFPKAKAGAIVNGRLDTSQDTYNAAGGITDYPILTEAAVSVATTIQKPYEFNYSLDIPYDWNQIPDDNLWGDRGPKSVYDPCPKGWRIAPNGTWDDFGTALGGVLGMNSGWAAPDVHVAGGLYTAGTVKAFYPAPGFRNRVNGKLYGVGQGARCWSSTITGINAHSLGFDYNAVNPNNYYGRITGLPVRCIQYVE